MDHSEREEVAHAVLSEISAGLMSHANIAAYALGVHHDLVLLNGGIDNLFNFVGRHSVCFRVVA